MKTPNHNSAEFRPDKAQNYSIETPFPGDQAPYKVIYTCPWNGKRSIVYSAATESRARKWLDDMWQDAAELDAFHLPEGAL